MCLIGRMAHHKTDKDNTAEVFKKALFFFEEERWIITGMFLLSLMDIRLSRNIHN